MPSPAIAFRASGVGLQAGFEALLREAWGYAPVPDGDEWIVLETDAAFQTRSREILKIDGPLPLTAKKRHKLAGKLLASIPGQLDEWLSQNAHPVKFDFNEDSLLNRAYACTTRLAVSPRDCIRNIIRDELLPLMSGLGATCIYIVTIDASYQQEIYAYTKLGSLGETHDPEEVTNLALRKKSFNGVLPNALDMLTYVNVLTRLAPLAFTLPAGHGDCVWHFASPSGFIFKPSVFCESLFQQFVDVRSPLAEDINVLPLGFGPALKRSESYLKMVIKGINTIISFLNDPRNFVVGERRLLDYGKQIQGYCAFDLLCSDIAALNLSTSGYHRISCSMNALDKISNMIKYLGEVPDTETGIFKSLLTERQRDLCCSIFLSRTCPIDEQIGGVLAHITRESYCRMHDHYRKNDPNLPEVRIAQTVRNQRNLRHGAFLEGRKFMHMFEKSEGTVANEIVAIAYLLTLALALDPRAFLRRNPGRIS